MLLRLRGLVMIVNTLLPAILFVAVAVIFFVFLRGLHQAWEQTRAPLEAMIKLAGDSAGVVGTVRTRVQAEVQQFQSKYDAAVKAFEGAQADLDAALKKLPAIQFALPTGLEATGTVDVKDPFTNTTIGRVPALRLTTHKWRFDLAAPLRPPFESALRAVDTALSPLADLREAIEHIRELATLQEKIDGFREESRKAAKAALAFLDVFEKLLTALAWLAIALMAWSAFAYAMWVQARLARGRDLLLGEAPPVR